MATSSPYGANGKVSFVTELFQPSKFQNTLILVYFQKDAFEGFQRKGKERKREFETEREGEMEREKQKGRERKSERNCQGNCKEGHEKPLKTYAS